MVIKLGVDGIRYADLIRILLLNLVRNKLVPRWGHGNIYKLNEWLDIVYYSTKVTNLKFLKNSVLLLGNIDDCITVGGDY